MHLFTPPIRSSILVVFSVLLGVAATIAVRAQSNDEITPQSTDLLSSFTYQGRLEQDGVPHTGVCDFQFVLQDTFSGPSTISELENSPGVAVTNGLFSVAMDFGSAVFDGVDRYLEVSVRCPSGSGSYVTLPGRQPLTRTPYAIQASSVPWSGITGIPAGFGDGIDNTSGSESGSFWSLSGNGGTNPSTDFVGTTDNVALEFRANNLRVFRIEPSSTSPNIIGGFPGNFATAGVVGATIAGGGSSNKPNRVTDNFGTIGGGGNNRTGNEDGDLTNAWYGTVAGGESNTALAYGSIGGGALNNTTGAAGTVSGGTNNSAGYYGTIGGGYANLTGGGDATVGGGSFNVASGDESTVGGGLGNSATASFATIGGGGRTDPENSSTGNRVTDTYGTIGGGGNNQAGDNAGTTDDRPYATVGGGASNSATDAFATVGGGEGNTAGVRATVGGGFSNAATSDSATIGGGYDNTASNDSTTVAGGWLNVASGNASVVGGGFNNQATKDRSTIAGGSDNVINGVGEDATIGGGYDNTVTADSATVAGGWTNTASGTAAFVGGGYGNTASGIDSMVVGGFSNTASGNYSFAAGTKAQADDFGAFVWGDGTDTNIFSPGGNTFSVRASGGIWLGTTNSPSIPANRFIQTTAGQTTPGTGAYLSSGGAWTNASDFRAKENFNAVDPRGVLKKLVDVPITTWNYISEDDSTMRMGPMAQDFYATFGLGDSETAISTIDAQGVAFASIQGLNAKVEDENTALRAQIAKLESENGDLETRLSRLESAAGFTSESDSPVSGWAFVSLGLVAGMAGLAILRKVR